MLKVDDALIELSQKSYAKIQEETAWKWASRAAASFQNVVNAEPSNKVACLLAAEEYYHEAIEHAALVESADGNLVEEIKQAVSGYATAAMQSAAVTLGLNL